MILTALKMLVGNKASFVGTIFGIFLATLLISQQSAIFLGLVSRSYRLVTDIPAPNVWVIDPATESDVKVRGMPEGYLGVIRSIPSVDWAVPINVMTVPLVTEAGIFQVAELYGIDDATLIGAPEDMVAGNVRDLRREGGVIIDSFSANGLLSTTLADGTKRPIQVGDSLEINHHRAVIVGIGKITQSFYPQPIVFTTFKEFKRFTSTDSMGFIAAKTAPGADVQKVLNAINSRPEFLGLTAEQFRLRIAESFLATGILINFGLSVGLGLIIGFSIAGQIFYIMTLQNLVYYALIKSLGGTQRMIIQMILFQALLVGVIGFSLGTGATILWGMAIKDTSLAFMFPWQLLVFTGSIVLLICLFTAGLSIRKVLSVDPKMLMGN